tara:strand:+ start:423 stop:614 length:192 start_codon:yes stop_codon:yes gene_type:complete
MAMEGEKIDIGYYDVCILYDALSYYAKQEPDMGKAEYAMSLADSFYRILLAEREEMESKAELD